MLMRVSLILTATMMLVGCGNSVQPPAKHAPIALDQVKLYQKSPSRYEYIGMIHIPVGGVVKFDQNGDANAGFEQFMTKAASMGANGVLFQATEAEANISVNAGYKGTFYVVPVKTNGSAREAVAQAIYVDSR